MKKMKKIKLLCVALCTLAWMSTVNAQDVSDASDVFNTSSTSLGNQASINNNTGSWSLIFGLNVVEDDASWNLTNIFHDASSNFSNPYFVGIEYYTSNNLSVNTTFSFNKYVEGKQIDGGVIQKGKEANYFAVDASLKYSFQELLNTSVFDPYLFAGLGYTSIGEHTGLYGDGLRTLPTIGRLTLNFGAGANFWISDTWGVNLNAMGKSGVKQDKYKNDEISNQLQFSLGGIYVFSNTKK